LYGKPTNINNVETWCNVPVIIEKGAEWFTTMGTERSPGTKVFSLVGKVKNTGLVELPLGSKLEQFVFNIGEGTGTSKRVKAVQTGGPSGGCIPLEFFSTPVDYESLAGIGAIMGSGGMVVMDQDNCMVDVARYFWSSMQENRAGNVHPAVKVRHRHWLFSPASPRGKDVRRFGLLELAQRCYQRFVALRSPRDETAPNPILTTLKYFRHEYEEHIPEKRCQQGRANRFFMALCENSCARCT
jgi:NADH-quinone oxidoreductase subunit F